MARENQGLQIGLIIFVMTSIVLAVTTYLAFSKKIESDQRLVASQKQEATTKQSFDKAQNDITELKRIIGAANTETTEAILTSFTEEMKKYGGAYPAESQYYRPLIAKLKQSIDEKNIELAAAQAKYEELDKKYALSEASKQPQITQFKSTVDKTTSDLTKTAADATKERQRMEEDQKKLQAQLETARKEGTEATTNLQSKLDEQNKKLNTAVEVAKQKSEQINKLTTSIVEVPAGEIRHVNQKDNTVWVNIGRADGLSTRMTFSVYGKDITDLTKGGGKKGSIEITHILGDHLAEGTIIDNQIRNPILPGDKIHTPLWNPGDQIHFALAGFLDIEGDGKGDLNAIMNFIRLNNGIIDSYMDEEGNKHGIMSYKTRYLILGERPTEKGKSSVIAGYSKMISDAETLGIQKLSLTELLQRMGYKKQSSILRYNSTDLGETPSPAAAAAGKGTGQSLPATRTPPPANNTENPAPAAGETPEPAGEDSIF